MEDIKIFKEKLFKKAEEEGFTDWEIYFTKTDFLDIKIFKGEVSQYKNSKVSGLSFRGVYNNKLSYAYTEKIDDNIIDTLLLSAKENSKINEKSEEIIFKYSKDYKNYEKIEKEHIVDKTTLEEKINLCKNLEKLTYEENEYVKSVDYCNLSNIYTKIYLSNKNNINLEDSSFVACVYISVTVEKNKDKKVASEFFVDKTFDNLDIKKLSKKVVNKALEKIGSRSIKPTKCNVVLKNEVSVDILNTFISNFYGESVQNGFSLLKGKLEEKIASSLVNIYDNINHNKSLKATFFDSEGVPTKNKTIIEKGVLKSYLYNLKSSKKEKKLSTGNGFRSSFKSTVTTSHLNFYIEEGNITFEEILKKLEDGLLITKISGLHAGTNVISGDFSLLAEGFFIKKGEIKFPVNQITIAGNFYDMLKNIINISNDLYFDIPNLGGSVGSPSILVKDINISGVEN